MRVSSLLLLLPAVFVQFGCVKDNSVGTGPADKTEGPVFNFETASTYNLNFKYDVPEGYVVGFDVYAEYPFETDAEGQTRLKVNASAVEKGFTDSKGAYNKPLEIPDYVKEIYIYTNSVGVPNRLLTAEISNGQLLIPQVYRAGGKSIASAKGTRAALAMNTIQTRYIKSGVYTPQTLTLSKWHMPKVGMVTTLATGDKVQFYGRPVEMSYVDKSRFGADAVGKNALTISGDVMSAIRTALPGDNMGIVEDKYLSSGDIHVSKETELDLIFIQNWGAYHNVLAYYCYETANPPQSAGDIKFQTIAIANAIEQKFEIETNYTYDIGSMYQGEGVKLKYVDANGVQHDKFPAGVSVGWVLYRDGFNMRKIDIDPETRELVQYPAVGYGANYSTPSLTAYPNTAVLKVGDFVVIGFDDGTGEKTKRDYLDLVFNVQASVPSAITDPIPDVKPEEPQPVNIAKQGILLFEDIWPFQGDFDMNDVVVGYVAEKTKNSKNEIVSSKVDFSILHSGASLNNTFAYVDPNVANADVTFTNGVGAASLPEIDRTNNIVYVANKLLDYANKANKVTFTVNYTYKSPIPATSFTDAPFNPFIVVGGESGKEVHLTNYMPSPIVDMSWFEKRTHDRSNPVENLYYITFENINAKESADRGMQLPWAVNIAYDSVEAMNDFRVTQESKPIYKHYLDFTKWVKSEGKEYTDWYLHFTE